MFWPILISSLGFWGIALGGAFYFARRYVRAVEAASPNAARIAELQRRIDVLEATVERQGALGPVTDAQARLPR